MAMSSTDPGIRLESVSLGKGLVSWRVNYPPLARRNRAVQPEYERLEDACAALIEHCAREDCDPETIERVERNCPGRTWKG